MSFVEFLDELGMNRADFCRLVGVNRETVDSLYHCNDDDIVPDKMKVGTIRDMLKNVPAARLVISFELE